MRMIRSILVLALWLAAAPASAHHLIDWVVIDIGAVRPGGQSFAIDVNNRGDVAGYALGSAVFSTGILWQNGVLRDIGVPQGSSGVVVNGMNADGVLVGVTQEDRAVQWKDGAWSFLGFVGEAKAINREGAIAGTQVIAGPHERAVLLRDGVLTELGTLGGPDSRVNAMNDWGHVVGRASLVDRSHPFRWANGEMRDLGSLDRHNSVATAINNHNVIVGDAFDDAAHMTAFLWYGRMFRLLPAFSQVFPFAINDRNDIVGRIEDTHTAFLLADGELVTLDRLPAVRAAHLTDLLPRAISEQRWIVGTAISPSGGVHGFVMMPDPAFNP
jgi:probable extracellular repeat, HAF family